MQYSNLAIAAHQWQEAAGLHSLLKVQLQRTYVQGAWRGLKEDRLAGAERLAGTRSVDGELRFLLQESATFGKIQPVDFQLLLRRVRQREAGSIALHGQSDAMRDHLEEFRQRQIRYHGVVYVEQQFQAVPFASYLGLQD